MNQGPEGEMHRGSRERGMAAGSEIALLSGLSGIGVVIAFLVFSTFPTLDLFVSNTFYSSESGFSSGYASLAATPRRLLMFGFVVFYITIVICGLQSWKQGKMPFGLGVSHWQYLAVTNIAGPLILTNLILKDNWGRARPRQTAEFGGQLEYTHFWEWSSQCQSNCSFVSGETSATVMVFISLALVSSRYRAFFYLMSIFAFGLSAMLRIVVGAHFLSDTVLAALFMVLVACGVYWLFFLRRRSAPIG